MHEPAAAHYERFQIAGLDRLINFRAPNADGGDNVGNGKSDAPRPEQYLTVINLRGRVGRKVVSMVTEFHVIPTCWRDAA